MLGGRKSEKASVHPLSAPAYFPHPPSLKIYGKGRPGQEIEGCGVKLSPSFAAELEFSLQASTVLPAFEEKLEDVD